MAWYGIGMAGQMVSWHPVTTFSSVPAALTVYSKLLYKPLNTHNERLQSSGPLLRHQQMIACHLFY